MRRTEIGMKLEENKLGRGEGWLREAEGRGRGRVGEAEWRGGGGEDGDWDEIGGSGTGRGWGGERERPGRVGGGRVEGKG